jgi:RNA polymerase sigma-70 factor (ECF subfamily)
MPDPMPDEDFAAFLARVRAGDEGAAADLVRRHESAIRREVRLRLTNPSVYRLLDDEDVCQSVLASFFVRASLGEFDLHDPAQLRQLLLSMARKKLAFATRRQHTQKRGGGRDAAAEVEDLEAAGDASVGRIVAGRDLLEQVRRRLSDEDRRVADLRGEGHGWAEVAGRLGGTPDGRRMQLTRALDRASRELGLEDGDD